VSPLDRHLTTEQLSAMLDHQLSPEEMEEGYQAHLQTCEPCQQELAELRQTVQLLRELPQPPLPRSFTLPITTSLQPTEEEAATLEDESVTERPIPIGTRRQTQLTRVSARRRSIQTALRMVSGLVAVIGICIVLTGLVNALNTTGFFPGHAANTSATTNSTDQANNTGTNSAATPTAAQASTHVSPANDPNHTVKPTPGISSTFLFIDINTTPGKFGLGILLAILGVMGFSLFKQRKKRYRP
jgi:anti-sigma factor RsiW